jgi:alpha-ketoglutarate-dependent taurine dioxygenase
MQLQTNDHGARRRADSSSSRPARRSGASRLGRPVNVLPILDISAFQVPQRFILAIAAHCTAEQERAAGLGVATPFETEEGQRALAEIAATFWPEIDELAALVRDTVALDPACVVLRGLGYNRYPQPIRDTLVLALTRGVGTPTDHNNDKRVLWPVKARAEEVRKTVDYKTTFSEEAGEAPLHSDSAFAASPEKYNALFVVKQAEEGGVSVLLNVPRLVDELARTVEGRECIEILRQSEFPFRVPDAFFKNDRIVTAPVLGDKPFVRFRYDCLMAGFALREELRTNERVWAIEHFRAKAEASEARVFYQLQQDEAIVIDNHVMLHARTDFTDRARHLIRVRMHAA